MRKRFLSLLCIPVILCALLLLPVSASGSRIFLSVNDTLQSQTAQTTPIQSGGWVYIPVDVFSSRISGVNLGIYYGLVDSNTSLVLYTISGKTMTFDLTAGTATAAGSTPPVPGTVIRQNGIYYVPAYAVCRYFGLTYSYLTTDYGPLLRIKDSQVILSDRVFISSAASMMREMISENQETVSSAEPSSPSLPASATPSASSPAKPSSSDSSGSSKANTAAPITIAAPVFSITWGVQASKNASFPDLLNALSSDNIRAVVFFPADEVEEYAFTLCQAAGEGHRIGLIPSGETAEDRLDSIRNGEKTVKRLIRQEIWFVMDADSTATKAGYLNWSSRLTLSASANSNTLYSNILEAGSKQTGTLCVLIDGALSPASFSAVSAALSADGDTFLTPKENHF